MPRVCYLVNANNVDASLAHNQLDMCRTLSSLVSPDQSVVCGFENLKISSVCSVVPSATKAAADPGTLCINPQPDYFSNLLIMIKP